MTSHPLRIPTSATLVSDNNTPTGHVWTIQFAGGERATVTAIHNEFTTTYRIQELFAFWTPDRGEIEQMLAAYAVKGNWEQEK